ncbi:MAG TPA: ATP-binding cassette domain-containing protein [Rhizobiaceae bacterium]|nr:ATP-binding cassette domain-containing protein [Rhizobiaceae bacterium]
MSEAEVNPVTVGSGQAVPAAAPLMKVAQVDVVRGSQTVLRDVSLTVRPGEIVTLVGASGAGKSTLLAVLNGLLPIAHGLIEAPEIGVLSTATRWRLHRLRMANIFQDLALVEQATALHNVLIGLAERRSRIDLLRGWSRQNILSAARLLQEFGIGHLAHSRVDRLSGGERRRVGAARALIRDAALLLADEPFNSLDPELARDLVRTFARQAAKGTGMVIALHQAELLPALAQRVVGLEQGRVVFDCPAADLGRRDLAALFSPSARSRNSSSTRKDNSDASVPRRPHSLSGGNPP